MKSKIKQFLHWSFNNKYGRITLFFIVIIGGIIGGTFAGTINHNHNVQLVNKNHYKTKTLSNKVETKVIYVPIDNNQSQYISNQTNAYLKSIANLNDYIPAITKINKDAILITLTHK